MTTIFLIEIYIGKQMQAQKNDLYMSLLVWADMRCIGQSGHMGRVEWSVGFAHIPFNLWCWVGERGIKGRIACMRRVIADECCQSPDHILTTVSHAETEFHKVDGTGPRDGNANQRRPEIIIYQVSVVSDYPLSGAHHTFISTEFTSISSNYSSTLNKLKHFTV